MEYTTLDGAGRYLVGYMREVRIWQNERLDRAEYLNHSRVTSMHITPRASIQIFGWFDQPHSVLMWSDVVGRKDLNLTWHKLRQEFDFTPQQLYSLQADKQQWISRGNLRTSDLPEMSIFPINPLSDLRVDIGELCVQQWDHEILSSMGVTYAQMKEYGMTPAIMSFYRFPLSGWVALGLQAEHVSAWTDREAIDTFGLGIPELCRIVDGK